MLKTRVVEAGETETNRDEGVCEEEMLSFGIGSVPLIEDLSQMPSSLSAAS